MPNNLLGLHTTCTRLGSTLTAPSGTSGSVRDKADTNLGDFSDVFFSSESAVDFIRDQMKTSLLTKLHELQKRASGIASRERVLRIAHEYRFDARPVGREVVCRLQGGEEVIVVVLVCGWLGKDDVDVCSRLDGMREAVCKLNYEN